MTSQPRRPPARFVPPAFLARILISLLAAALVASCGGSSESDNSGLRFLLASEKGLSEVSGSKERVLVRFDDGSYVLDPAVSPDGRLIAFVRQPPASQKDGAVDYGSNVYVANRDGSSVREAVRHSRPGEFIDTPVWLPSGRDLAFTVRGQTKDGEPDLRIETLNLDTGQKRRLIENGVNAALSPDGKTIAFVFINPDTLLESPSLFDLVSGRSQTLPGYDRGLVFINSLAWSPDGTRLAFGAADPSVRAPAVTPPAVFAATHPFLQDVWLVNRDGANLRRLNELAESRPSLTWSEDGASIYAIGASGFWRIDVVSGERQIIGPGVPQGQIFLLHGR